LHPDENWGNNDAAMQKFILAILITCNLFAGLETASDIEDVWMEWGLLDGVASNADYSGDDPGNEGIGGEDCDHCCHASAHLVAFTSSQSVLGDYSSTSQIGFLSKHFGRTGRAPPIPPPIV